MISKKQLEADKELCRKATEEDWYGSGKLANRALDHFPQYIKELERLTAVLKTIADGRFARGSPLVGAEAAMKLAHEALNPKKD